MNNQSKSHYFYVGLKYHDDATKLDKTLTFSHPFTFEKVNTSAFEEIVKESKNRISLTDPAGIPLEIHILSVSYLGHMTKDEFES
ncbi:hypothetical protein R4487_08715 [Acinetobacter baumannii]|nr:hypothetical protein [Acinetobacter baumannii]